MMWLVVAAAVLVVVAAALISTRMRFPGESTQQNGEMGADTTDQRFYKGVDRPAGPDAEDPNFEARGQ